METFERSLPFFHYSHIFHFSFAFRIEFPEEVEEEASGSGSGELLTEEESSKGGLSLLFFILVPTAGVLLLGIPFCIALRSKACLCKQCC